MTNIPPGFTDLTLRAMAKPEEIDIKNYEIIPFKGKLKKLTGREHTPFKMIHVIYDKRKITIQVFYLKEEQKVYINDIIYEKYKSEITAYFAVEAKEGVVTSNVGSIVNSIEDNSLRINKSEEEVQNGEHSVKEAEPKRIIYEKGSVSEGLKIKEYLLSDFGDHNYRRKSIIDIYFYNRDHFIALKREKKIKKEAIDFFNHSCFLLEEAQKIPTEAFRKLRYDEIVSGYIKDHYETKENAIESSKVNASKEVADEKGLPKETTCSIQKKTEEKESDKVIISDNVIEANTKQDTPLHCVNDHQVLIKCDEAKVHNKKNKEKTFIMPMYACPQCMRLYTSIRGYKDLGKVSYKGDTYTNLSVSEDSNRYDHYLSTPHPLEPGSKCYVYESKKPLKCRVCQNTALKMRGVFTGNSNHYHTLFCSNCNIHYLKWNEYKKRYLEWNLLNPEEYQSILKEQERINEEKERAKEEQRKKQEELKAAKKARKELQRQEKERKKQEELRRKKELAEKRKKEIELQKQRAKLSQQLYDKQIQNHLQDSNSSAKEHDNRIRVKDFVVRRTTFKCMHEGHSLRNIDGIIEIINDKGIIIQAQVPAGYCPNCNVFFIMESTYQRLKMKGTPICRISDEKTYMKSNVYANGMRLAQESILMQYGYSVSQQEGLSANRRSKILAVLIDNDILTRTEIISYLDFFINQRKNNSKYEKAIQKWEMDQEFVSEYKAGAYTQYGISGISRKH